MNGDAGIGGCYPIETSNGLIRTVRIYHVFIFTTTAIKSIRASENKKGFTIYYSEKNLQLLYDIKSGRKL